MPALCVNELSWSNNQVDRSTEVGNAIYPTFSDISAFERNGARTNSCRHHSNEASTCAKTPRTFRGPQNIEVGPQSQQTAAELTASKPSRHPHEVHDLFASGGWIQIQIHSMLIPKKEHRFQVAYRRGVHFRIFSPHVPHQKFAD